MNRDMDLIRSILLEIEDGKDWFETTSDESASILGIESTGISREEAERLEYHLNLLEQAGYAEFTKAGTGWIPDGLTWAGHDFAATVRDDDIWQKTKEGAQAARGFTVDLLAALAKGFIKKQIESRTGVTLDL